jgi:hypothetical protein
MILNPLQGMFFSFVSEWDTNFQQLSKIPLGILQRESWIFWIVILWSLQKYIVFIIPENLNEPFMFGHIELDYMWRVIQSVLLTLAVTNWGHWKDKRASV